MTELEQKMQIFKSKFSRKTVNCFYNGIFSQKGEFYIFIISIKKLFSNIDYYKSVANDIFLPEPGLDDHGDGQELHRRIRSIEPESADAREGQESGRRPEGVDDDDVNNEDVWVVAR